jgi:uncharacterized OsmC-like protein
MNDSLCRALVSARVTVRDRQSITLFARSHEVTVGPVLSFDAHEPRLTGMEHLLAAVAADVVGGFRRLADRRRLVVDEIEAVLKGEIADPLVHLGVVGEEGEPRLARLEVRVFAGTSEPDSRLRPVWEEMLRRAPVINTLRPGVELDLQIQITG